MKTERYLWMSPLVGVLATAGCAQIFGFDKEYRLVDDAGAGGSGGSPAGNIGSLGEPCPRTGALACAGHAQKSKLICGPDGQWVTNGTCDGKTLCDSATGPEQGTCKVPVPVCTGQLGADIVCAGVKRVRCGPDLVTTEEVEACPNACVGGRCSGVCKPESKQCADNTLQTCNASGAWQNETACAEQNQICVAGACVVPPSCKGLPANCGASGNELCCASNLVTGGSFNRSNDQSSPATISTFRLDRFEITVGRFRRFSASYMMNKPTAGAGAHPLIPGSGWDTAWDAKLPQDKPALLASIKCDSNPTPNPAPVNPTWTDEAGANETLPMNCINWYEAMAFCAWDGGRLPTEAEWNYAAAGGNEQRNYPWVAANADAAHAVFDCTGDGSSNQDCKFTDILKVGSKSPKGDGKWGQADLAGSMGEWNLDSHVDPYSIASCNDCAYIQKDSARVIRGGNWKLGMLYLPSSFRSYFSPDYSLEGGGARCARTP